MRFTTKLLPSRSGNLGIITLNNPEKLHALTLDMCYCFQDVLSQHSKDESLKAILIKSSSWNSNSSKRPAFCAGGDVKELYESGRQQSNDDSGGAICHGQGQPGVPTADFFRQEYYVNHMMATMNHRIPQISIWNGVTMGGGVGISIHGRYRVATEHTLFAMPETAIGLFPDVGSTYWMPRLLASSCATYLAMTGRRLKAPDLIALGLATHYVPSQKLDALETELVRATMTSSSMQNNNDVVAPVLDAFHETPPGKIELEPVQAEIEHAFHNLDTSFEEIIHTLQGMDTEFSTVTLSTLQQMSPTSLKITLEGLKRGKHAANITECLHTEFRMAQACMRPGSDFYEGIRAVLVDKNNPPPRWNPSTWDEVSDDVVQTYFDEIRCEWEIPEELLVHH